MVWRKKMKILLTGGSGLFGRAFVELAEGGDI